LNPLSGFIFLEQYAEDRKSDTWTSAVKKSTEGMPFEIIKVTSDEAKALTGVSEIGDFFDAK
jgi:hypothetical protein